MDINFQQIVTDMDILFTINNKRIIIEKKRKDNNELTQQSINHTADWMIVVGKLNATYLFRYKNEEETEAENT